MKKFTQPDMRVILFKEDIITASGCFEVYACEGCYCGFVVCDSHAAKCPLDKCDFYEE